MRTPLVALALMSVAALTGCGSSDGSDATGTSETTAATTTASPADALWGRTFLSTSVTGTAIPGGGPFEVAFPERDRIAMSAGCNRGVGSVDLSGGTVKAGPIATTMMACPGDVAAADTWMADVFAATPAWTLTNDVLTLSSPGVTIELADKKTTDPDRPVIGTTWTVDTLISADAIMSSQAIETAAATLTIGQDGQVSGSSGCNRFSGPVTVGDSTITFGPLASTKMACADEAVAEVERSVLHVLDGEVTYAVDGPTMRLTKADGTGLGLRAR
ncbi:META domain-containing protein [Prescottella subtropica]|uniref:META domain-containing protein n=1 Tax=Prescottella subtropica TaxID=2545757 RepID=UPI0010F4439B|nr:META domain-containing protein [Prescottella subtropica]